MIHVKYAASNPGGAPTLILAASLGTDREMWREQVLLLPSAWNVVTFDLRGHGASPLTSRIPTIDDFADDVVSIADDLGVDRFAFCGLSIGGAIGQSLGARYPDRVSSLVLASTGLTILTRAALIERSERVLREGTAWIADASAPRWFTERFRDEHPDIVDAKMDHLRHMAPRAYADACLALAGFDGHAIARSISVPTLVLSGEDDVATPPSGCAELAAAIPGAKLGSLPGSAHLCSVERPELFTEFVQRHVEAHH
ncbi:alpha/beta fold hydrolase [Streptomyces sp. NBC_00631]|uniref:alpha/beta fold hydrolase n=1 Tax=Streptomyces sp. NBC_00631 TaxID=2975793 RepID=UPI0030DF5FB6